MPEVWQTRKEKYADEAFSGEGRASRAAVLTASAILWSTRRSSSRLPSWRFWSTSRSTGFCRVTAHFERIFPIGTLISSVARNCPRGSKWPPMLTVVRTIGDRWIRSEESLTFRGPSTAVPAERNVLITPATRRSRRWKPRPLRSGDQRLAAMICLGE